MTRDAPSARTRKPVGQRPPATSLELICGGPMSLGNSIRSSMRASAGVTMNSAAAIAMVMIPRFGRANQKQNVQNPGVPLQHSLRVTDTLKFATTTTER